MLIKQSHHIR